MKRLSKIILSILTILVFPAFSILAPNVHAETKSASQNKAAVINIRPKKNFIQKMKNQIGEANKQIIGSIKSSINKAQGKSQKSIKVKKAPKLIINENKRKNSQKYRKKIQKRKAALRRLNARKKASKR